MPCTATKSPALATALQSALYTVMPAQRSGAASSAGKSSGSAATAGITHKAVAAMPAHPHTLTRLPVGYTFAHRIHVPSDLMTWHARIVQARPETVFHHHIAVADAASFDFDAHLSASGL